MWHEPGPPPISGNVTVLDVVIKLKSQCGNRVCQIDDAQHQKETTSSIRIKQPAQKSPPRQGKCEFEFRPRLAPTIAGQQYHRCFQAGNTH